MEQLSIAELANRLSPVLMPYALAGPLLARMMPCRVSVLPQIAEGIFRRSVSSPSTLRRYAAVQDKKALLTSI